VSPDSVVGTTNYHCGARNFDRERQISIGTGKSRSGTGNLDRDEEIPIGKEKYSCGSDQDRVVAGAGGWCRDQAGPGMARAGAGSRNGGRGLYGHCQANSRSTGGREILAAETEFAIGSLRGCSRTARAGAGMNGEPRDREIGPAIAARSTGPGHLAAGMAEMRAGTAPIFPGCAASEGRSPEFFPWPARARPGFGAATLEKEWHGRPRRGQRVIHEYGVKRDQREAVS
jgi:hypothetical protein